MPIIGQVEKRSLPNRILNLAIHLILILGGITMIYPLCIMVSGSIKSAVDITEFSILPEYILNFREDPDEMLFRKYVFTKNNGGTAAIFRDYREPALPILSLHSPDPRQFSRTKLRDVKDFLDRVHKDLPHYWRTVGGSNEVGVYACMSRRWLEHLQKRFGSGRSSIYEVNRALGTDYTEWEEVKPPYEYLLGRSYELDYNTSPLMKEYLKFKNTDTPEMRLYTCYGNYENTYALLLSRKHGRKIEEINRALGTDWNSLSEISLAERLPDNPKLVPQWKRTVLRVLNSACVIMDPETVEAFRRYLEKRYKTVDRLNRTFGKRFRSFSEIPIPRNLQPDAPEAWLRQDLHRFLPQADPAGVRAVTFGSLYRDFLKKRYGTVEKMNQAYDCGYRSFEEVPLSRTQPYGASQAGDWEEFQKRLTFARKELDRRAVFDFRAYAAGLYADQKGKVDFAKMSSDYGKAIREPREIPFVTSPADKTLTDKQRKDLVRFFLSPEGERHRVLRDTDSLRKEWLEFLKKRYHSSLKELNRAYGYQPDRWDKVTFPQKMLDWSLMQTHKKELIGEYLKRNYAMVFQTLFRSGNAAFNTLIYCLLAVLATLIVNPLCAYALSRYKPASAYKILLFLMLPMAIPGMVIGIPQFLLVKKLGLLNTFAALILPGMASGYSVFLLKGFFDSLPRELYESAAIDGANEWVVFWHISIRLSTPILAVLALGSFTAAYANFMLAFLLCQDKSMWTMMVYLFQLQQYSSQAVGFAALIIAAVPTLLVFIFCQNIIIKGIVVPTEK